MSLREVLVSGPVISVTATQEGGLFSGDDTETDEVELPISLDLLLADLQVGSTGNNILEGNGDTRTETINIEEVSITLFGDSVPLENADPVQLENTPFDFLIGFGGNDTLSGSGGIDILFGDSFSPVDGGFGNDVLNGDQDNDYLFGGGNGDVLNGGNGDDLLFGDYFSGLLEENIPININEELVEDFEIDIFDTLFDALGIVGDILDIGGIASAIGNFFFGGSVEIDETRISFGPFEIPIGSGQEGNDILNGGAGNDLAIGDRGDDTINGDEGNDSLIGSADNDIINGGDGDDLIIGDYVVPQGFSVSLPDGGQFDIDLGSTGNDTMSGGAGNDVISGDDGIDTVTYSQDPQGITVTLGVLFIPGVGTAQDGFDGNDLLSGIENIIGSSFNDQITGDSASNVITARAGDDTVSGGGDNDTLLGEEGNDLLNGDDGEDLLNGGQGKDIVSGGRGNDILNGEEGNDFLNGDDGDDVLRGGKGADVLNGGFFGRDTASYSTSEIGVSVNLTTGETKSGDARGDLLIDVENLEGSNLGDELIGNFINNEIFGLGGDDQISGEAGDDSLNGQTGDDFLFGGLGNDELFGEAGRDLLFGEDGNDQLFGGNEFDELDGGSGEDQLFGEAGNDKLFGKAGDDQLFGGVGNDTLDGDIDSDILWGDGGNDILLGKTGNDFLDGGDGTDELDAGDGDDILDGGSGTNSLKGGKGKDLFVLTDFGQETISTIVDFEVGKDLLGLKDGLSFGQLQISQQTNNTIISTSSTLAILSNVEVDSLTAEDFVIV